jgi:hypothetical protein
LIYRRHCERAAPLSTHHIRTPFLYQQIAIPVLVLMWSGAHFELAGVGISVAISHLLTSSTFVSPCSAAASAATNICPDARRGAVIPSRPGLAIRRKTD